jgi:outer membrane protein
MALASCSHLLPSSYSERRLSEPLPTGARPEAPPEPAAPAPPATPQPSPTAPAQLGPPVPPALAASAPAAAAPLRVGGLAELLDLALRSDPGTRAAWLDARAAAATAGARRAAWFPVLDGSARLQRFQAPGTTDPEVRHTDAGVSAQLTWLLVDLGARGASQDEAEQQLLAARLAHESAVLDLALRVEEAWYGYQTSRALLVASDAAVKQAEASLAAAEERRSAGAATVADVLQARTALSQLLLDVQRVEGQSAGLRGRLASLAGLSPTVELAVPKLPEDVHADQALPAVERLLDEAARANPDLARARALADAADARARAVSRADLPTLSGTAGAGLVWPVAPESDRYTVWSAGLVLNVPLFAGGRPTFDAASARSSADAARQRTTATGRQVELDVWIAFQALRTAARRGQTARDLLASATAGVEVATGRYREGVGSILDLLTSQSSLESALAEEILARADWLLAMARLARATGRLPPVTAGAAP